MLDYLPRVVNICFTFSQEIFNDRSVSILCSFVKGRETSLKLKRLKRLCLWFWSLHIFKKWAFEMNSFLNPNRNQTTRVKYSSTITEVISKGNLFTDRKFLRFFSCQKKFKIYLNTTHRSRRIPQTRWTDSKIRITFLFLTDK